ncbi:DUF2634 domain-containing protein [Clostridium botulinum C]|uniref:DUF2634 domain-containing protein n=2 Tax=Clostridium botulinum TaxID=1491 RepID=A0A9Q4TMJ2_CLOBO|nr:DUF2634 domain-containing protein [Clostridium botulinum]EGO86274.1 phage-like element pbsx protein XkdS [Clostridium botulinum C str. Stockholm]MCD3195688.1 DUF2634 domain-containing protein [Clostridium botulinum C]MCD3201104.1 DUF2634 domain-containing protein [Clostridium botulinum C]MCD3206644.1 DUF2634 domain-containing protein [Clostridium botulinum C]MCD3209357.1 DUF2634 domain-containing protein [Clostridium botulinum C]
MPNLFPESIEFEENNIEELLEEPSEFKGSYLFDFKKREFVKNPDGTIAKCDAFKAYIQWCNKALLTPRYKLAYDDLYGQEFKSIIGSGLSKPAIELEIKRMTIETLMVHPKTKDVTNFKFKWSNNKEELYYIFEVLTTTYEKTILDNIVKVR